MTVYYYAPGSLPLGEWCVHPLLLLQRQPIRELYAVPATFHERSDIGMTCPVRVVHDINPIVGTEELERRLLVQTEKLAEGQDLGRAHILTRFALDVAHRELYRGELTHLLDGLHRLLECDLVRFRVEH